MKLDQDELRKKHDDLAQAYREKNKKLLQTQELYDKLKRKAMLGQIQDAAEDAVDSTLHSVPIGGGGFGDTVPSTVLYQESGIPYGQPPQTLHEQPRTTESYPSRTINQGPWFRTVGAQCKNGLVRAVTKLIF
jgi:E3 ubiquitin-protein ligase CCNP1IP1